MMDQLGLFQDQHPKARRADPASSKRAGATNERSGAGRRQRDEVLAALKRYPDSTSRELAELGRLDRYLTARRLPELLREGLVERFGGNVGEYRWRLKPWS